MGNSDPCHLPEDAVAETTVRINEHMTAIQSLMELFADQMDALLLCRLENPEPPSEEDPPGPPGGP